MAREQRGEQPAGAAKRGGQPDGRDREQADTGGASGKLGGDYRRSSRCLQVTHIVARGKTWSRSLPIGWPQDSQEP